MISESKALIIDTAMLRSLSLAGIAVPIARECSLTGFACRSPCLGGCHRLEAPLLPPLDEDLESVSKENYDFSEDEPDAGTFAPIKLKGFTWTSMAALCLMTLASSLDIQFIHNSYRGLEIDLGFDSQVIANLSSATLLGWAIASPVWGALTDRFSRKRVLLAGYLGWALPMLLLAFSSYPWQFYILRFVKGALGSCLFPATTSILMEVVPPSRYGIVQGGFFFLSQFFMTIGAYVGVSVSQVAVQGVGAWRYGYGFCAALGVVVSIIVAVFMQEPSNTRTYIPLTWGAEWQRIKKYIGSCMIWIVIVIGVFSSGPSCATTYLTLFYQYNGISDQQVGRILVITGFIGPFANIIGGYVSDWLEMKYPHKGRIYTGMFSVVVVLTFKVWLILLPVDENYFDHAVILNCLVLLFWWTTVSVNHPIYAEVVDPDDRGVMFAWLVCLEAVFASFFIYPSLGELSKAAGYYVSREPIAETPLVHRVNNANALADAMLPLIIGGWLVNLVMYVFALSRYGKAVQLRQEKQQ